MNSAHRQVFVRGESNTNLYFSTGRKVPKAHRGGQPVHEGVAAPDPPYPNCLSAHPRGVALISPRGGVVLGLGKALARHHIQHASSTGSLVWGGYPSKQDFAAAAATRGLSGRPLDSFGAPSGWRGMYSVTNGGNNIEYNGWRGYLYSAANFII